MGKRAGVDSASTGSEWENEQMQIVTHFSTIEPTKTTEFVLLATAERKRENTTQLLLARMHTNLLRPT